MCLARSAGNSMRLPLRARLASRPGCGKSITSGALPPCETHVDLGLELVGAVPLDLDAGAVDERLVRSHVVGDRVVGVESRTGEKICDGLALVLLRALDLTVQDRIRRAVAGCYRRRAVGRTRLSEPHAASTSDKLTAAKAMRLVFIGIPLRMLDHGACARRGNGVEFPWNIPRRTITLRADREKTFGYDFCNSPATEGDPWATLS